MKARFFGLFFEIVLPGVLLCDPLTPFKGFIQGEIYFVSFLSFAMK